MEKILRRIDALKLPSLSGAESNIPGSISSAVVAATDTVKTKKKERMSHCRAVAEAVTNPSVQGLTDYNKILESVVEVLFQLCNDPDSDIRSVAVECLIRIARTLKDSFQPKFHMEVYKEIRKNQSPRSLKTAMQLFAFICPGIRGGKCRAFLTSLLPCLSQIARRTEELLYENLAASVVDIFKYLGRFALESEVKIVWKDFMANLDSTSAIVRRASASILVGVAKYSKNPPGMTTQLLASVIDLLVPGLMEKSVTVILGVLLTIRQTLPLIHEYLQDELINADQEKTLSNLVLVYEICMVLCNHDDHNVITTSLETLQELFSSPCEAFARTMVSSDGIRNSLEEKSFVFKHSGTTPSKSGEMLNEVFGAEDNLLLESDFDVPTFRSLGEEDLSIRSASRRSSDLFIIEGTLSDVGSLQSGGGVSESDLPDNREYTATKTIPDNTRPIIPEIHVQIGSLYEKNVPIHYCARFLSYNFLLSGQKDLIRSDSEVRTSVKVLAFNCLVDLVQLSPTVFHLPLSPNSSPDDGSLEDVLLYSSHSDPLLRGAVYMLAGQYLRLANYFPNFFESNQIDSNIVDQLVSVLTNGLKDPSNVGVKCALSGIRSCLSQMLRMEHKCRGRTLLKNIFAIKGNQYWLVRVELIDLVSSLAFVTCEDNREIVNLLLEFLHDEDPRVRNCAVSGIIRFLKNCQPTGKLDDAEESRVFCRGCVEKVFMDSKKNCLSCSCLSKSTEPVLENILARLREKLTLGDDKHALVGCLSALCQLSEIPLFSPKVVGDFWSIPLMLNICVDLLRSSPLVYDLGAHQIVLTLAGNLFISNQEKQHEKAKRSETDKTQVFCSNANAVGTLLLQHCLAVMKLYHTVMEKSGLPHVKKDRPSSPVISPVKKFSQKLEAEKKAQESEAEKKSKGPLFSGTTCPQHLKKLDDCLTQSWRIYKASLDPNVTAKFVSLFVSSLETMSKIFPKINPDYSDLTSIIQEILSVLTTSSVFNLFPIAVLKLIRAMLNGIFSKFNGSMEAGRVEKLKRHTSVFHQIDIQDFFNFSTNFENELVEQYLKDKKDGKSNPEEKSMLSSHIRQFESAVVTALRIYTTTSDPEIHCEVLALLVQLIKGHVNYGLVDSSQVFLGFVIKQITLLEEGSLRHPEALAGEIFKFFCVLTHESSSSKRFLEVSKVVELSKSLISATETNDTLGPTALSALTEVIKDVFIFRVADSATNQEKLGLEQHRAMIYEKILQMSGSSEALVGLSLLLKGRKLGNENKWMEDSEGVVGEILKRLSNTSPCLTLKRVSDFNLLICLLHSVSISALPTEECLIARISDSLQKQSSDLIRFCRWTVNANVNWLLLLKRNVDCESQMREETSNSLSMLFVKLALKLFSDFSQVVMGLERDAVGFAVSLIEAFLQISGSFFKLLQEPPLRSYENVAGLQDLCKKACNLESLEPSLRKWLIRFLASFNYPIVSVWETLLSKSPAFQERVMEDAILGILAFLNEGDVPTLEEYIIVNFTPVLLSNIQSADVKMFLRRLSTYRTEQVLDQITILLDKDAQLDNTLSRSILTFLEKAKDSFLCECGVLAIKLLQKSNCPITELDANRLCASILLQVNSRKVLFSSKDREFLKNFFASSRVKDRFPRLLALAEKIVLEEAPTGSSLSSQSDNFGLLLNWCYGTNSVEMTASEGYAVVKTLDKLKYLQLTDIFTNPKLNMQVLKFCFRYIRRDKQKGKITSEEILDLLSSQKRPTLMERFPLAVASIDFLLEVLDTLENFKTEDLKYEKIVSLWSALTELLDVKKESETDLQTVPECSSNFVPTSVFTLSFQWIENRLTSVPLLQYQELCTFLTFAAAALRDHTFLNFFDFRDNSSNIFKCIFSLGVICKRLQANFKITFGTTQSEDAEVGESMNEECSHVLSEFNYLVRFIQEPEVQEVLDPGIHSGLRKVIAGLGRCELLNGWVLISHLGWKPDNLSKNECVFPPIQQIPLEILRSEPDMLLKYIQKLNLLGVSSKIQFEENWVIFLSVINLYVDESFQLQIVVTGLRALSMMLQGSVKPTYRFQPVSETKNHISKTIDFTLDELMPPYCRDIDIRNIALKAERSFDNHLGIDVNSCIRFLTDLYSQWLQNPQGKMPLALLSEVVYSIVILGEYFEDSTQYSWMHETLVEIQKGLEKDDEMLWPHLMYGIFYAAAKLDLEGEPITNLAAQLETMLSHSCANMSVAAVKCSIAFLQSQPDCMPVINVVLPYALKNTQLDAMMNDSEVHCLKLWEVILCVWVNSKTLTEEFEQDIVRNVLTALSHLNKVYISIRLLILKCLRVKIERGNLKGDVKKTVGKMILDTLKTTNISVFFDSLKLFLTVFYDDFGDSVDKPDLDPEILMPIAERTDVLFQIVRGKAKFQSQLVARAIPLIIDDFLPPSEILNRVIAEFLAPVQLNPDLIAPSVASVFEKARRRGPSTLNLLGEWIQASLPNFLASGNSLRVMWSLSIFFIGLSHNPQLFSLLPIAQLSASPSEVKELFINASVDFYSQLDEKKRVRFKKLLTEGPFHPEEKHPFTFLVKILNKIDDSEN